jgi:hypothetical protein
MLAEVVLQDAADGPFHRLIVCWFSNSIDS